MNGVVEGHHPLFEGDWILMLLMEEKQKVKTISGISCLVVCMALVNQTHCCSHRIYTLFLDTIIQTIHEVGNITAHLVQGDIHHCCRVKGRMGLKVLEQGMEGVEDMAGAGNMMAAVLGTMVAVLAIVVNTTVVVGGLVVEVMCTTLLAGIQAPTPMTCECS